MTKISAKIIADSINPQGQRITSFILTYPRMIHGELMTHRVFSRNSASSRAIPFKKMMEMVEKDPFIPIAWQKDHKGMQGTEYFTKSDLAAEEFKEEIPDTAIEHLTQVWLAARDNAVRHAKYANEIGLTKQICNRILEPFMWHTVLVTATEFDNFFELRCPQYNYLFDFYKSRKEVIEKSTNGKYNDGRDLSTFTDIDWLKINVSPAEIHIQALAEAMWDEYNGSDPKQLKPGEWHIPFSDNINDDEILQKIAKKEEVSHLETAYDIYQYYAIKIATARCARLSYMTFEGKIDYEKDIALHDQLFNSKHYSPFEHCARAMSDDEYETYIKGKCNYYQMTTNLRPLLPDDENYGWCNNFKGFIPYRYLLESQLKNNMVMHNEIKQLIRSADKEENGKQESDKALRYNEGKPKWSLVHYESLIPMIRVLEFGALKYAPRNWIKPMNETEILESMQRHLAALMDGEEFDQESGINHMGHIQANAMFYNYHHNKNKQNG